MKNIKNFAFAAMMIIAGTSSVFMTSCAKFEERCPSGYTGSKCDSTFSDKYLGNYQVVETKDGANNPPVFNSSITKASSTPATTIVISNFANSGVAVPATINNADKITLQSTAIGGRTVTGSGSFAGIGIHITYKISGDTSIYTNIFFPL